MIRYLKIRFLKAEKTILPFENNTSTRNFLELGFIFSNDETEVNANDKFFIQSIN